MSSRHSSPNHVSIRDVLRLAWPASIAASVTPLLGTIDVWALGQSERPLDIAAVGLGSIIFSLAYWTFGFIRMSVAGLTAQAAGADNEAEARAILLRGVALGGVLGLGLVLLQWPIASAAFPLLSVGSEASEPTLGAARDYYDIRIWGAPFALATYAAFGWLTARGRTDFLMVASLAMTLLNVVLDYWFVIGLGWGAQGVAVGTLIAETVGFLISVFFIALILGKTGGLWTQWNLSSLFDADQIKRTLSVNRDIFIRTLLLAFSFAWFVQRGGAFGDVTLAANQTLMQLFLFTGLALDGTAIAAETLVGRAIGLRDRALGKLRYDAAVRATFIPALIAAVFFAALYWFFGEAIIAMLAPPGEIRLAAIEFLPWVAISPLIVVIGFQLDGIFIGATRAREMRNGMIITTLIFIPTTLFLAAPFGNHGLWAAFSLYFVLRAVTLAVYLPRIGQGFNDPH